LFVARKSNSNNSSPANSQRNSRKSGERTSRKSGEQKSPKTPVKKMVVTASMELEHSMTHVLPPVTVAPQGGMSSPPRSAVSRGERKKHFGKYLILLFWFLSIR
jgi:hypothetical protein